MSNMYIAHHGIKGQKWGERNGPPYPLDAAGKLKNVYSLNKLMNSEWEYGVLHNGKHIGEDRLGDFDWGKDYRTIPVKTLEKEKIGTCWDYVNYQHDKLDGMGIKNDSYLLFIQRNPDKAEDAVTHTFTVFEPGDGKQYWLESAAWPKRGVHEISGVEDVVKEMNDLYGNKEFGYSLFKYNPKGTDKGLTGDEFIEKATVDENYVMDKPGKYSHLAHHGILGQKWGVRRFQNKDGTRTALGKAKEREHTVFVSGSSKTQTKKSEYYRKKLPSEIQNELQRHMKAGDKIIVGDAPGIDRQVQDYLNKQRYDNVEVYGPGKNVRYSANKKWKTNPIDAPEFEEGSKEWLAKKDIAMTKAADEGLAVVLDEGAKATRKNVERLINDNKDVRVFELNKGGIDLDRWVEHDDLKEDPHKYGIPEQKKFPMPDADHVRSAIKFFNYVAPKHEKQLAKAILDRMDEYGLTFDDFGVGDENRFKKYIPKEHLEHHGILGQKWGKRNGPPYPLNKNYLDSCRKEKISKNIIDKYKDQAKQLSHVRINDNTNGVIFSKDGKLIGMINVEDKSDGAKWIQGLELFNDGKGKGLSYRLLDYATRDLGATNLSVNKSNTVAKHVYDKYGFETYDQNDSMYFMKLGDHLEHHGILGQKWGVRRYQNSDGTLTPAGLRRYRREAARLEKKDSKWARKNYDKIYKQTYKKGRSELNDYLVNDLNKRVRMKNADGKISLTYANEYNRKLAEVMNKNVGEIHAPSGKVVQYIAKRGSVGVHMALVDSNNFDMSSVRRGVYGDGRVAYKQDKIARA